MPEVARTQLRRARRVRREGAEPRAAREDVRPARAALADPLQDQENAQPQRADRVAAGRLAIDAREPQRIAPGMEVRVPLAAQRLGRGARDARIGTGRLAMMDRLPHLRAPDQVLRAAPARRGAAAALPQLLGPRELGQDMREHLRRRARRQRRMIEFQDDVGQENRVPRRQNDPAPQVERHDFGARSPSMQHIRSAADLVGPIRHVRMTDPVVAPNGITYERTALEALARNHRLPGMQGPIDMNLVFPDIDTRQRLDGQEASGEDPITYEALTEPVIASDGRTYNRSTLQQLFQQSGGISPFTREQLRPFGYRHFGAEERLRRQRGDATLPDGREQAVVTLAPQPHVARRQGPRRILGEIG